MDLRRLIKKTIWIDKNIVANTHKTILSIRTFVDNSILDEDIHECQTQHKHKYIILIIWYLSSDVR